MKGIEIMDTTSAEVMRNAQEMADMALVVCDMSECVTLEDFKALHERYKEKLQELRVKNSKS